MQSLSPKNPPVERDRSPSAHSKGPPPKRRIITPSEFVSRRTNKLPRRIKSLLLVFEMYAQDHCYAWPDVSTLAEDYGCRRSRMFELLSEAVALDVLRRIEAEPGRRRCSVRRCGTIYLLLQRVDPNLPVFTPGQDNIEDVRQAVARLTAQRERGMQSSELDVKVRKTGQSWSGKPELAPRSLLISRCR